jgi:hypothetical protein
MSAPLEVLPLDKESLLARSALCRLRLRRDGHELRHALHWKRVAMGVAAAPDTRRIVLGLAFSLVGFARAARVVLLAGRIIVVAKLAASFIAYARGRLVRDDRRLE